MHRWRGWAVLVVVLVAAAAQPLLARQLEGGVSVPDTVTLYVAAPADLDISYGVADAARHEAELAMAWVEEQAGRRFRRGPDFAEIVHLSRPAADYRGPAERATGLVLEEVLAVAARDEATFPVVLAMLRSDPEGARQVTCAMGGPGGVAVLVDNCRQRPSTASAWGSGVSTVIAHELVHGLGAVRACAPHASPDGHVTDDPADIVHVRALQVSPHLLVLDAGRDDYFGHGMDDCPDIADSPLWLD